jgi:dihydroflavonol-4-reductase
VSGVRVVTGATGLIGTRLVSRLLDDDVPLRLFVRSLDRVPADVRPRVEIAVGDLADPGALRRALDGAQVVYHLAGLAAAWAPDPGRFFDVNVEGVRRVLAAAQLGGVQRLVHVSTVLTRFHPGSALTPYWASKVEGERLVRRYVAAGGDAVIARPCRVYGPGPLNDANGVTRLVRTALRGVPIRLADGDVQGNYVHVDDVVDGLVLAARRGRAGAGYMLGGENSTVADLLELVRELADRPPRWRARTVPPSLALAAAGALEAAGRLGIPVPITRGWVRTFLQDQPVDIGPTSLSLGYHPRPLRTGLAQTVEWLEAGAGRAA